MINVGIGERGRLPWDGSVATFQEYRAQGAPIGFAPDPRTGHWCGDSRYLAIPFFDACLQMRLSDWANILKPVDLSSAWLSVPFGETAVPAAEYKGDPARLCGFQTQWSRKSGWNMSKRDRQRDEHTARSSQCAGEGRRFRQ